MKRRLLVFLLTAALLLGLTPGAFAEEYLTRAELCVAIVENLHLSCDITDVENPFTDLDGTEPFYEAAMICYKLDAMHGYSATQFRPSWGCSRDGLADILFRLGLRSAAPATIPEDISSSHWAYYAICAVLAAGAMSCRQDGKFYPYDTADVNDVNWSAFNALANPSTETVSLDLSQGSIAITGKLTGGTEFVQNDTVIRSAGPCVVRQSDTAAPTANTITVTDGTVSLTIADLNICSETASIALSNANVSLNLVGSSTLTSTQIDGIAVPDGSILTISGSGSVAATGGAEGSAIGKIWGGSGIITIHSGTVVATGTGRYGVGIGGGNNDEYGGGIITINGGTVTAAGGYYGAGIGGGKSSGGGTIIINGGTVTAAGGYCGAGIGAGAWGDGWAIEISGGTVAATSEDGAGIGGGFWPKGGGTVSISNAEVTACGNQCAIGSGSADNQYGCDAITIDSSATVHVSHTYQDGEDYIEKINITTQPSHSAGHASARLHIDANGHSGLTYQWQVSDDNETWTDAAGKITPTIDVPVDAGSDGRYYRCCLTNGWGNTICSDSARAYVLAFAQQPQSVATGLNDMASLSVTSTCGSVSYQWERSYDGGISWVNVPGETYATLLVNATLSENDALYRCVITAANGDALASDAARITVSSSGVTYTVNYYLEKADGSGYDLADRIITAQAAGATVAAPTRSYAHFTENTAKAVTTGTVKADGSLVLARYYDRARYTLCFQCSGGTALPVLTERYGAALSAPGAPSRPGYVFSGWYADAALTRPYTFDTMPGEDLTLYAGWEAIGASRGLEYSINAIVLRDESYAVIDRAPRGRFYAEVSVTNLSSATTDTLVLAAYDTSGRLLELRFLYANPPVGYTFVLGAGLDNSAGHIARLKAFMLPVLGGVVPLAETMERSV